MKTQFKNKRAFTLIELLIVIAIIGILFIVLVSKVDFATDKAKATGVQTDFRSFQTAFEQVARENSGFATLGWDTGDDNGDRIRNSYDKGDNGAGGGIAQNGIQDGSEVFVGSKTYGENWTGTYTLVNPDNSKDSSAFVALENAINANLDPKLHLTITPNTDASGNLTGSAAITMANQARDPWKNEYAGAYITNATVDSLDRGSIIMYSTGANGNLGVNYSVSGGLVGVEVPGSNINGKDDYVLSVTYSYANGYGEVQTGTAGFSNNQSTLTSTPIVDNGVNAGGMSAGTGSVPGGNGGQTPSEPSEPSEPAGPGPGGYQMLSGSSITQTISGPAVFRSSAERESFEKVTINGTDISPSQYTITRGSTVVKLLGRYVDTLDNGTYEIEIHSTGGTAKATLVVNIECRNHEYDEFMPWCCAVCGISYCLFEECYSSIDCFCDWCGNDNMYYNSHYDTDIDGYCDVCDLIQCSNITGGGDAPCHDNNEDHYCDGCNEIAHSDKINDCICDICYAILDHEDCNFDGYCDGCNAVYCERGRCHDLNKDHSCDYCNTEMCDSNDGDCLCDSCNGICHIDYSASGEDYYGDDRDDGYCDRCRAVYCQGDIFGWSPYFCHDANNDCYCDWCGSGDSSYHSDWDDGEPNGYCDYCGEFLGCTYGGPCVSDDDCYCNTCWQAMHIDENADGYCDNCFGKMCEILVNDICEPDQNCVCRWCDTATHTFENNQCERCRIYICEYTGCCIDVSSHEGSCDSCGTILGASLCVDSNNDGRCDEYGHYLCSFEDCWSFDNDCYCDCCGYKCHVDYEDYDGICDICGTCKWGCYDGDEDGYCNSCYKTYT